MNHLGLRIQTLKPKETLNPKPQKELPTKAPDEGPKRPHPAVAIPKPHFGLKGLGTKV